MKTKLFKSIIIMLTLTFVLVSCQSEDEVNLIENANSEDLSIEDKESIIPLLREQYVANGMDESLIDVYIDSELSNIRESLVETNPTVSEKSSQRADIVYKTGGVFDVFIKNRTTAYQDLDESANSCKGTHRHTDEAPHTTSAEIINGNSGLFVRTQAIANFYGNDGRDRFSDKNRITKSLYIWEWNFSKRKWIMKIKKVNSPSSGPVHRLTSNDYISYFVPESPRRTTYVYAMAISKLIKDRCGNSINIPSGRQGVMYKIKS